MFLIPRESDGIAFILITLYKREIVIIRISFSSKTYFSTKSKTCCRRWWWHDFLHRLRFYATDFDEYNELDHEKFENRT